MRNHDQKVTDMIESVLPSVARDFARRERAAINRRARRTTRHSLRAVAGLAEPDDLVLRPDRARRTSIAEMVRERRAADKIGPLTRWALRTVEGDSALRGLGLEDQVEHFRRLLPDSTIGRHALSHIRWALEFKTRRLRLRPYASDSDAADLLEFVEAAFAVLDAGMLGELNRRIKDQLPHSESGRCPPGWLLAGAHDVERFAACFGGGRRVALVLAQEIRRSQVRRSTSTRRWVAAEAVVVGPGAAEGHEASGPARRLRRRQANRPALP